VLEVGEAKVKVVVTPVSPVCGLDPPSTATGDRSEEHALEVPLYKVAV